MCIRDSYQRGVQTGQRRPENDQIGLRVAVAAALRQLQHCREIVVSRRYASRCAGRAVSGCVQPTAPQQRRIPLSRRTHQCCGRRRTRLEDALDHSDRISETLTDGILPEQGVAWPPLQSAAAATLQFGHCRSMSISSRRTVSVTATGRPSTTIIRARTRSAATTSIPTTGSSA